MHVMNVHVGMFYVCTLHLPMHTCRASLNTYYLKCVYVAPHPLLLRLLTFTTFSVVLRAIRISCVIIEHVRRVLCWLRNGAIKTIHIWSMWYVVRIGVVNPPSWSYTCSLFTLKWALTFYATFNNVLSEHSFCRARSWLVWGSCLLVELICHVLHSNYTVNTETVWVSIECF